MSKLFSKSLNGVKVPHSKNTAEMETVKMPVPDKVVIPMKQHMGRECTPTVKLTDLVKVGQIIGDTDAFIGAPIHSSVSGKVTKIDEIIGEHVALRPAGIGSLKGLCPFHDERTPPFNVRPHLGLSPCCGQPGRMWEANPQLSKWNSVFQCSRGF